jgi:hypothetical protein
MHHAVGVTSEAATPAPTLHKLDQAEISELVQMALNRPGRTPEDHGQGGHTRPAQARLVVGVVGERGVGGNNLDRHALSDELANLRYAGKLHTGPLIGGLHHKPGDRPGFFLCSSYKNPADHLGGNFVGFGHRYLQGSSSPEERACSIHGESNHLLQVPILLKDRETLDNELLVEYIADGVHIARI